MRFWVLGYPAADARPSCDVQLSNDDRRGLRTPIRDCARDRRLRLARALDEILLELNAGRLRVAEKIDGTWITHQWVKKAVLLYRTTTTVMPGGGRSWFDKVPLRFAGYTEEQFRHDGFRVVPPATVRAGAFIGRNVVLMPSYVNIGAYVGEGTMVDTWATVGSCAQIGKNVHLSGGAGIGGVLELQANPTIIEDNCFVGARSEIVEGVIVEENAVISMGVFIGQSTKIYDRATREVIYGRVPAGSVVAPGNLPSADGTHRLLCGHRQRVDAATRAKTSINEPSIVRDDRRRHPAGPPTGGAALFCRSLTPTMGRAG